MKSTPLIFGLIKYEELNGLCCRIVNFYFKERFRVGLIKEKQEKDLVKQYGNLYLMMSSQFTNIPIKLLFYVAINVENLLSRKEF